MLAYHRLTTQGEASARFDTLFQSLCAPAPVEVVAHAATRNTLESCACDHWLDQTLIRLSDPRKALPMAFAPLWIADRLSCNAYRMRRTCVLPRTANALLSCQFGIFCRNAV